MYSKLALRNVKKSFRDYAIYFLTLMFGVCIFYVFNSIDSQQSLMVITESTSRSMEALQMIIGYVSVFVSVILGFLIVYANRFLVRRRKKELGIYQVLGMEKGQISRILTIETLFVAIISLAAGLALGVVISQGFALLTASLFEVKLAAGFNFIFSSSAALKAILYFGIAFFMVIVFNRITVGRQKLIDLLYAERKNEKFRMQHLILSVIVFILSAACLGTAYYLVEKNGLMILDEILMTAIVLGVVGTFLFFFSLSGFFLKVVQQSKKVYYKGLNMFVLRQINSKINTAFVSISMVCLMLFLSICAVSFGMGFSKSLTSELERLHPYDATSNLMVFIPTSEKELIGTKDIIVIPVDVMAELNKVKTPVASYARDISVVHMGEIHFTPPDMYDSLMNGNYMSLSDYNKCLELQGKAPVTLKANEMIFNCLNEKHREDFSEYIANNKITVSDTDMVLKNVDDTVIYNVAAIGNHDCFRVLPDELLKDAIQYVNIINVQFIDDTTEYKDLYLQAMLEMYENLEAEHQNHEGSVYISISHATRLGNFESSKSASVTIAYLAVYLGIVFAVISAAVLAITQLSEASDNSHRYGLLRKLGTDGKLIDSALFKQIAIYFGVPLMLALVHSAFGIRFANTMIANIGKTNILRDSLITAGVLVVVYGGYFLATYWGSKRIVTRN